MYYYFGYLMQIAPRFHSQNGRWIGASIDGDDGGGGVVMTVLSLY